MTDNIEALNEATSIQNEASLVFHKIVSMLDHGHVDMTEKSISFNVGALIKKSAYNSLEVVIRIGSNHEARLGKHKTKGHLVIAIETDELPARKQIDSFLERKEIAASFMRAFRSYAKKHHDHKAEHPKHREEIESEVNTPERFEELYGEVVKHVDEAVTNYGKTKDESGDVFSKFNIHKQETQKVTMTILQKDFFGGTEDEFASKFMKMVPETAHLQKVYKEKMISRLKTLYHAKVRSAL